MTGGTRRMLLGVGGLLALLGTVGFAAPAQACSWSQPFFSVQRNGAAGTPTRVRVEQALQIGENATILAVRATLQEDSAAGRRGDSIVIVVPTYSPDNCYYFGFHDPAGATGDGTFIGYVDLLPAPEPSGAIAAAAAHRGDALHFERFARGRAQGQWVRARFRTGEGASE